MASLQARHTRTCPLAPWSTFAAATSDECTCEMGKGPVYYVRARVGGRLTSERVGRNRKEAERRLTKVQSAEDDGDYVAPARLTFAEWAEQWMTELETRNTTRDSYRSTIAYANQRFGGRQLRTITGTDLKDLLTWLRVEKGLSASTRAKHLRVVGAVFEAAVVRGLVSRNPRGQIAKSARPRPKKRERGYFTNAEIPRLISEFPEGMYRTMLEVALGTGARQGELIALTWDDVSLLDGSIRVARTHSGGETVEPKNGEPRNVAMLGSTADRLRAWFAEVGSPSGDTLVFPGWSEGGYLDRSTLTRNVLGGAMKRAGIPKVGPNAAPRNWHSLRHTFAKLALEGDAPMTWVRDQMGHSSITVTVDRYGHWETQERRRVADALGGQFRFAAEGSR